MFVPKALRFNGKAHWVASITPFQHEQSTSSYWQSAPSRAYRPPNKDTLFLTCPKCSKVEPSLHKDFQLRDLDTKHKCSHQQCGVKSCIRNWSCHCFGNEGWFYCHTHAWSISTHQFIIKKPNALINAPLPKHRKVKRNSPSTYAELRSEDTLRGYKRSRPTTDELPLGTNVLFSGDVARPTPHLRRRLTTAFVLRSVQRHLARDT